MERTRGEKVNFLMDVWLNFYNHFYMFTKSNIEWTETTWNPTTGCTKVSAGCTNCYAEKLAKRLKAMGVKKYKNNFKFTIHPGALTYPLQLKKPSVIFVNSMSDLFHGDMPISFLRKVFAVMNQSPQHIFQVLTKRHKNLLKLAPKLNWTDNIWMGVSVENVDNIERIRYLKKTPAKVKFISAEPLLGPLPHMPLKGIDWTIVGGESGPKARPIDEEWVLGIKDQCEKSNTAFFFKQWGGINKKKAGRTLKGKVWSAYPEQKILHQRQQQLALA